MPFLALGGTTMPVALEEFRSSREEVGRVTRAFDGTPRSSVRSRDDTWEVPLQWVPVATGATLLTAIEGTPPLAATGDLTGSVNVVTANVQKTYMKFADGEYVKISFTMLGGA